MTLKSISLKNRPGVSIAWPERHAFALSYETITVYDLKLTNENESVLAVAAATVKAPNCLLRPTRFTVPGKSQIYLTMVFMPGVLFTEEDLTRSDKALKLKTAFPASMKINTFLPFFFVPFDTKTKQEMEAATMRATQSLANGLNASPMHFHCTSPGYVTAYVYLYYSSAYEQSIDWRLTPSSPFWYSLENPCKLGTFPSEGTQHDQYTFGYLSPGASVFTYIDLKAYGGECIQKGGFKGDEQVFVLESFGAQDDGERVSILLSHDVSEELVEKLSAMRPPKRLPSSDVSFVFSGQSASLTLVNERQTNLLVYRLQAQEPSLFTFALSFGEFLTIPPKQSATLTVELKPGAQLNSNHLFRLDTFLYFEQDGEKCTEWTLEMWIKKMMRSMEARKMETFFIPCIFKEEHKKPESPPNTAIPEATSNKPSTGSADKQMAMVDNKQSPIGSSTVPQSTRSTVNSPSGAANSPQPSPEIPLSKPAIPLPTPAPTEAQRKSSATMPNSSVLWNRHKEKKKTKKTVSPKPTLAAATQQTLAQRPTPEAASKPSTGSADKQMAMVDKQSPTGSATVPPSTGSTVKSPSGAANSAQPSPETPPNKPAIITVRTASNAPSTAVPGNILPQTISSVCRQRNAPSQAKKKENEKKTVSPMRTFTPKAAFPGAAKPPTAKSKLLVPSKLAPRNHSPGTAKPRTAQSRPVAPSKSPHHASPGRLPCSRAPFAPVGHPRAQDMVALLQIIVSLAICLILLNALITALE